MTVHESQHVSFIAVRLTYAVFEAAQRYFLFLLGRVLIPFQADDLVDDLCVVRVQHVEEFVVGLLEEGLQAILRNLKDIFLAELEAVNLLAFEDFWHVRSQEKSDLLFEVDRDQG